MRRVLPVLAGFAFGLACGWAGHPRPDTPRHMTLHVPVNWHPEPVRLRVIGEGEETEGLGPVWRVQVGTTTYSGVRE